MTGYSTGYGVVVCALLFGFVFSGAGSAGAERRIGFDEPGMEGIVRVGRDVVEVFRSSDERFVRSGTHSLAVSLVEGYHAAADGRAVLDLAIEPAESLAGLRALSLWIYVPGELAAFAFGRNDVSIFLNGRDPRHIQAAVKPGWNHVRWEFKNLNRFPDLESLRVVAGPFLAGYGEGTLYLDEIVFERMEPLSDADPEGCAWLIRETSDWVQRIQAVRWLERHGGVESLRPLLDATADGQGDFGVDPGVFSVAQAVAGVETSGSQSVRSDARNAVAKKVEHVGSEAWPFLLEGISSVDPRIRQAVVEVAGNMGGGVPGGDVRELLEAGLRDRSYYVRAAALSAFELKGASHESIARQMGRLLQSDQQLDMQAAIRLLVDLGSSAEPVLEELMGIVLRDDLPLDLRCRAMVAVWNADERRILPRDWVLALSLNPGEVHRHLLNVATDRLLRSGRDAVPALVDVLTWADPEARSRSATILGKMDAEAEGAVSALEERLQDDAWFVRYEAARALERIGAETEQAFGVLRQIDRLRVRMEADAVEVTQDEEGVWFDNGIIQMRFDPSSYNPGPEVVRRGEWGANLFSTRWIEQMMAFKDSPAANMLERAWFQKIFGAPINKEFYGRVVTADDEQAHYAFIFPATATVFFEWEMHYVLRRGDSGFYMYATVRNTATDRRGLDRDPRAADSIGEFRLLLTPTWGIYDTLMLHDRLKGPAKYTFSPQGFMPYSDIYQSTYRMLDGEIDSKHEWCNYELESHVIGLCNREQGLWFIMPAFDSLDGSLPNLHVHSVNRNMFVIHCEGKYYTDTATVIAPGREKIYGPFLFYINEGGSREELWTDAKRKAAGEVSRWPYAWVPHEGYHRRGSIAGRVERDDGGDAGGTWVILANPRPDIPTDYYGEWMLDTGPYRYWTRTAADGSFCIDHVAEGEYSLFAWRPGMSGETRRDGICVADGEKTEAGLVRLDAEKADTIVWQIGNPDRAVKEFRNGDRMHQWDAYLRYRLDFPEDVVFIAGESDAGRDWNYTQPAAAQGETGPVTWTIHFDLDEEPVRDGKLSIACIGRYARMNLDLNGKEIGTIAIEGRRIGAHIRSAPYDELYLRGFPVGKEQLRRGRNTLRLTVDSSRAESDRDDLHFQAWTSYMAYDFIRFDWVDDINGKNQKNVLTE